jgi:hypothetical protein
MMTTVQIESLQGYNIEALQSYCFGPFHHTIRDTVSGRLLMPLATIFDAISP